MTTPNPFAQNVPAQQQAQPATAAPNPFAQQQAAPPAAPQGNPYAQAQQHVQQPVQAYAPPAAPQQAPPAQGAPNPFAQQQAAPQRQYAPPAAPQGPYGQTAAPQQQYAPAPQQGPAPALGTATAPPPPVAGGGKGAKLPDMYGRLVLVFPLQLQRVPKNAKYITDADRAAGNLDQDRMTATVIVLDDGQGGMQPIAWGGNPHALGGSPHTELSPLPYVRKGMWLNQSQVIGQLSPYLPGRERGGPNGAPGAAVGRLVKTGPEQNAPWYLTTPTEAELSLANTYLNLVGQGQYPHPLA